MSTRRLTTEQFIEKARKVHGDKYGYSGVVYVNAHSKVTIFCKEHGEFRQSPANHFSGRGCPKCAGKNKTTKELIGQFRSVHAGKYDYSLVKYKNAVTKVDIICKDHGVFKQTPSNHLHGKGCVDCGRVTTLRLNTKTTEEFIKEAREVHGNKYDYSLVKYVGAHDVATIICKEHGEFKQNAASHINGSGCRKCGYVSAGKSRRKNLEYFIEKSKSVHGDKYDYSLVNYSVSTKKVNIVCKKHGLFEQSPNNHLSKIGCPVCGIERSAKHNQINSPGWTTNNWEKQANRSSNYDSFKVYIIKCWNDDELFYKIGRTFTRVEHRFKNKRAMPYNYEIINEFIFETAKGAFDKENELKKLNKKFKYLPKIKFDGMYECFIKIKEITDKIEKENESKN